jgi:hypothetical protein
MNLLENPEPAERRPSPAVRAGQLMAQARAAAFEQTRLVDDALRRMISCARDIAEGGDVYPAPIRDLCSRLADDTDHRRQLLESLAVRGLDPAGGARSGV